MLKSKKLLIVEDDIVIATITKKALHKYSYEDILIANNGEEAIDLFKKHNIDFVLMDIDLGSGIDGTETAKIILKNHNIPILFLSSHTEPEIVEKTEKITSYGYVVKNSGITVLDASIKMAFKLFEAHNNLSIRENNLKKTQTYAHIGSWTWNIVNNNLIWSDEMYSIFGIDKQNFTGSLEKVITEAIHPDDRAKVEQSNLNVINENKPQPIEYRVIWPDNSIHTVWAEAGELILNKEGKAIQLSGYIQDITERKKLENSLQESNQKFYKAFHFSDIGMALISPEGKWLQVNPTVCKITGYTSDELSNLTFQHITHPDDLETDLNYVKQMLDGQLKNYSMEKRYFHKNGNIINVLLSVSLVRDSNGSPSYFISQIQDITERKIIENELSKRNDFLNSIIDNNPYSLWISDENGTLIKINKSCCNLLKVKPEKVIGKYNLFTDNIVQKSGFMPLIKKVFDNAETVNFEIHYDTSALENVTIEDTVNLHLDITIFPIIDQNKKVINAVVQHFDVVNHKPIKI
jgi:PAS domain S-box-containing protein